MARQATIQHVTFEALLPFAGDEQKAGRTMADQKSGGYRFPLSGSYWGAAFFWRSWNIHAQAAISLMDALNEDPALRGEAYIAENVLWWAAAVGRLERELARAS